MPLTPEKRNEARLNAENRYLREGGTADSTEAMEADPLYQSILRDEYAFIANRHIAREREQHQQNQQTPAVRQDTAAVPCGSPEEENETVNCHFETLTVNKSGDSNRIYRSNGRDAAVLELVAGHTRAKTTVECVLAGIVISNCTTHDQRVWNVSPAVNGTDLTKNDQLKLDLLWKGDRSSLGFFNLNASPTVYHISANTHNKQKSIEVRIYPDHAWEGSASISFRLEEGTRRILYDGTGIQLSRTDDGVTTQFGGKLNQVLEILRRFLQMIFQIKDVTERVTAGACPWDIVPPCFTLTINSKWQENTTNLRCGYYYNGRLAFDPLVGIQLVINLGVIAIKAIPVVGELVAHMAGKDITRYVAVTLTLQGTIGVDVSFSKNAEEESGRITGGATGRASFDFQIRAQFNRDLYFVAINCGIRGGARGSITGSIRGPQIDRTGSHVALEATFDGLTVYAAAYARAGASQETTQRTPDFTTRPRRWRMMQTEHDLSDETRSEEAGGAAERVYPWVDPRPLGSARFNL